MNESTGGGGAVSALLKTLQDILHNRIIKKKGEIHESHNKIYNENLWREIETLHWVLAKILTLLMQRPLQHYRNKIIILIVKMRKRAGVILVAARSRGVKKKRAKR